MKKHISRLLSLLLVAAFVVMLFPAFAVPASAASPDNVVKRLQRMKEKYPDGHYWNHYVSEPSEAGDVLSNSGDERFAESTSSERSCDFHGQASAKYYVGKRDCNYFDGGMQCVGFARRVFYEVFDGHRCSGLTPRKDKENIQPGDYVRFAFHENDVYGHSVIVTEVNGTKIKVVECNSGGNCRISWGGEYDLNVGVPAVGGGNYPFSYFCHADNYDEVNSLDVDFYAELYYPHGGCNLRSNNGNVELAAASNGFDPAAIWHFVWTPEGYEITNLQDWNCLDAAGRGTEPGTNVQTYEDNDTPAQRWILRRDSGGRENCYNLAASYSTSLVLDVYWEGQAPGTNVQLFTSKSNAAQAFELRRSGYIEAILGAMRK